MQEQPLHMFHTYKKQEQRSGAYTPIGLLSSGYFFSSLLVDALTVYITEVSRTLSEKNEQKEYSFFVAHKMEVAGKKKGWLDAKSQKRSCVFDMPWLVCS